MKTRLISFSGVTKQPVHKRGLFPVNWAAAGCHLLYLTRDIRVSHSKHAHLHKYAVKHTLAAPGCARGDGGENEAFPASRLTSHRGCYAKEKKPQNKTERKSKQNVGRWGLCQKNNMFGPNDILQVRKSVFIRLQHVAAQWLQMWRTVTRAPCSSTVSKYWYWSCVFLLWKSSFLHHFADSLCHIYLYM